MGKFNEYTQKATPADNDTLMIYDATSKSNKLLPFSGIRNWIVGKLTNAVISNLQMNNKTVLGAINELNSKPPLVADIHNTDIELYLSKLGESYFAMLYFSYRNTNAPVVDGFKWEYFSAIIIKSRIIAFSPSGNPGAVITRQYVDGKLSNWTQIK
jgi:hypothetical protein